MFPRVDNTEIARRLNEKGFKTKTGRIYQDETLKTGIRDITSAPNLEKPVLVKR